MRYIRTGSPPFQNQKARPVTDLSIGGWTPIPASPTTLFDKIDEVNVDDADYIQSTGNPSNDAVELGLTSLGDPQSSTGHILRYRYEKDIAANVIDLTVELKQGSTVIASFSHNNITTSWVTAQQTLSGAQADSITDYGSLRIRFVANQSG